MPSNETDTAETPQKLVAVALKRERARAGLSLSEVARRADIAKSTLSQLEIRTRKSEPRNTVGTRKRIGRAVLTTRRLSGTGPFS